LTAGERDDLEFRTALRLLGEHASETAAARTRHAATGGTHDDR
jgi:hypothetical protein